MTDGEGLARLAVDRARRTIAGRPAGCPDRFVFLTISGAHLYGFPSADSDIDLRGAHLLPLFTGAAGSIT